MLGTRERRFLRYSGIGITTFLLDVTVLFCVVQYTDVSYVLATPFIFLGAISLNYLLSRKLVFTRSVRNAYTGYVYFLCVALFGALLTTFGMWVLVDLYGGDIILARIVTGSVIGVGNYVLNLYVNFEVAGQDL